MSLFDKAKEMATSPEAQELAKKALEKGQEAISNIMAGNKPAGERQLEEAKETAEQVAESSEKVAASPETAGSKPNSDEDRQPTE
jgi:hypothetical protein